MGDITPIDQAAEDRSRRNVPADLDAERAVLGAMLIGVESRNRAAAVLTAAEFYRPAHGHLFDAILAVHGSGAEHGPVDARGVADVLRRRGQIEGLGGDAALNTIITLAAPSSTVARHARTISEMAALRRMIGACSDAIHGAYGLPGDVAAFLDGVTAATAQIDLPSVDPPDIPTFDAFADAALERPDWVVPPLLERGDRAIVVAGEGMGKGVLLRQIAIAAAQGVNPFWTTTRIPPVRSLLIDLENPASIIRKTADQMLAKAITQVRGDYDPDRARIWHEPSGIDLRSRADFARFDAACAAARPDLVCVGPLYKMFRKQRGESDEDAALDVTSRLDDLRTRHGFALVIEHHAPKGGPGHREMTPFGSAVWMRWPEFGPALYPHPKAAPGSRKHLLWGHWRGPRDVRPWPVEMMWDSGWPWTFKFDDDDAAEHRAVDAQETF